MFRCFKGFTYKPAKISLIADMTGKRANKILGIISIAIGLANIVAFIVIISISVEQSIIVSVFWLLILAFICLSRKRNKSIEKGKDKRNI